MHTDTLLAIMAAILESGDRAENRANLSPPSQYVDRAARLLEAARKHANT